MAATIRVDGRGGLNVATCNLLLDATGTGARRPALPGDYVVRLTAGGAAPVESRLRVNRFSRWTR